MSRAFTRPLKLLADRRGVAAVEFALIVPVVVFVLIAFIEVSARARASEGADRFAKNVADLITREASITTESLRSIRDIAPLMITPSGDAKSLTLDVTSIGFEKNNNAPVIRWRRTSNGALDLPLEKAKDLGSSQSGLIRVGVSYPAKTPFGGLFGGAGRIERHAFMRPRAIREIELDGRANHDGDTREL